MPIGGLKEKLLAAHRGGITTVILPKENRKDLRDVPRRVLKALRLVLVEHVDDVLREALVLPDPTPSSVRGPTAVLIYLDGEPVASRTAQPRRRWRGRGAAWGARSAAWRRWIASAGRAAWSLRAAREQPRPASLAAGCRKGFRRAARRASRARMIRRALLSVSDKTGLVPFAQALAARGVELLSTGGTHKALAAAGIPVTTVEAYTGSPEVMDGRVKTLHPRVHGGILMRGAVDDADLERLGGRPIDLVVVNLYPFAETVAKPGRLARGHHREHRHRRALHGPLGRQEPRARHGRHRSRDYAAVARRDRSHRRGLRRPPGAASRPRRSPTPPPTTGASPPTSPRSRRGRRARPRRALPPLPHPRLGARLLASATARTPTRAAPSTATAARARARWPPPKSLGAGGKELSFNNLVDVDAALDAVREFSRARRRRGQAHQPLRRGRRRRASPPPTASPARPTR